MLPSLFPGCCQKGTSVDLPTRRISTGVVHLIMSRWLKRRKKRWNLLFPTPLWMKHKSEVSMWAANPLASLFLQCIRERANTVEIRESQCYRKTPILCLKAQIWLQWKYVDTLAERPTWFHLPAKVFARITMTYILQGVKWWPLVQWQQIFPLRAVLNMALCWNRLRFLCPWRIPFPLNSATFPKNLYSGIHPTGE